MLGRVGGFAFGAAKLGAGILVTAVGVSQMADLNNQQYLAADTLTRSRAMGMSDEWKAKDFLAEQKRIGVPAEALFNATLDEAQVFLMEASTPGPIAYRPVVGPESTWRDLVVKLGGSERWKSGILIDPGAATHEMEPDGGNSALQIFKGRYMGWLKAQRGVISPENKLVTFSAGSLNTVAGTQNSSQGLLTELSTNPPLHYAGGAGAETGISQYMKSAWARQVNPGRSGYELALTASIGMSYFAKRSLGNIRTANVAHSWGCPSMVQKYAYALVVQEAAGHGGPPPIDEIVLVDPRFIATSTQARAFASQIHFLRSRGVKVQVIKDESWTAGFGAVTGASATRFIEQASGDNAWNAVGVDSVVKTASGHSIANHFKLITDFLSKS